MKLIVDVNLSPRVVAALRDAGHDAVRVTDILDAHAADESIVAEAISRAAVIVTRDQDFSTLVATSGLVEPSLVNLRVAVVESAEVARLIDAVIHAHERGLTAGAIITVNDDRVRIRRLPLG